MSKSAFEARISDFHYQRDTEYERTYKAQMRAMVPASPPLRILDIGCGTGLNTSHLVKSGHKVIGIDLPPVAIDKYCNQGFDGHLCDIEAGSLPFEPASFDLVFAPGSSSIAATRKHFCKKPTGRRSRMAAFSF
jgi:SAM-dependent methyltransferase